MSTVCCFAAECNYHKLVVCVLSWPAFCHGLQPVMACRLCPVLAYVLFWPVALRGRCDPFWPPASPLWPVMTRRGPLWPVVARRGPSWPVVAHQWARCRWTSLLAVISTAVLSSPLICHGFVTLSVMMMRDCLPSAASPSSVCETCNSGRVLLHARFPLPPPRVATVTRFSAADCVPLPPPRPTHPPHTHARTHTHTHTHLTAISLTCAKITVINKESACILTTGLTQRRQRRCINQSRSLVGDAVYSFDAAIREYSVFFRLDCCCPRVSFSV